MSSYEDLFGGTLRYKVEVDTKEAETSTSKVISGFDRLKNAAEVASGILMRDLVRGLGRTAVESLNLGGRIETLRRSYENLAKTSSTEVSSLEDMRRATQGMVSDYNLLQAANQAVALGLPTEKLDELQAAAIKLGKAMGLDAKSSIDSLTSGIGRQSRLMLDNLGVIVDTQVAYDWYAEKIGVATSAMDENTKAQGWMAYAIDQVIKKGERLGDNISETEKMQEKWTAAIMNAKTAVGEFLGPLAAISPIVEGLLPSLSFMAAQALPGIIASLKATTGATSTWGAVTASVSSAVSGILSANPYFLMAAAAVAAIATIILVYNDWRQRTDELILAQNRLKDAQAEVSRAENELESASQRAKSAAEAEKVANESLLKTIKDRSEAARNLADRQRELIESERDLEMANSNLASMVSYLMGATMGYEAVTRNLTWSTDAAKQVFGDLTAELSGLQAEYNSTMATINGMNSTMKGLNREEQELSLEQMKLRDAYEDGGMSQKRYEKQNKVLEARMRDLRIKQAELRMEMDDARDSADEQSTGIDSLVGKINELKAVDDAAETAAEDHRKKLDEVKDAEVKLKETSDTLSDALTNLISKQVDSAKAHQDAAAAAKAQERAYWSLVAAENAEAAIRKKREQEEAMRLMGVTPAFGGVPGLQAGGIVRKPTLAVVGEHGPEAVVPLRGPEASRFSPVERGTGEDGTTIHLTLSPSFGSVSGNIRDPRERKYITRMMADEFMEELRRKGVKIG